jgi:hypothetical protein
MRRGVLASLIRFAISAQAGSPILTSPRWANVRVERVSS